MVRVHRGTDNVSLSPSHRGSWDTRVYPKCSYSAKVKEELNKGSKALSLSLNQNNIIETSRYNDNFGTVHPYKA
jgi:hypothetical protein